MKNRFTTESPPAVEAGAMQARGCAPIEEMTLTDAELRVVSGGLNPQPLPPCVEPRFI
jgi:hypothetical protein